MKISFGQPRNVKFPQQGLTLIEVLVALAILAIALSALLQSTARTIQTTQRIDEKNTKHWVAMQAITAIQLKTIPLSSGETSDHNIIMLGKKWYFKVQSQPTFIKTMNQVTITVSEKKIGPFTDPLMGFYHE